MKRFDAKFYFTLLATLLLTTPAFAAGHGGEEHGFNPLFFAGVCVNFVIFCFLLVKFATPALNKHYAKQREDLIAHLDAAKRLREAAEAKLHEYQARLDGLETERQEILDKYHAQGVVERERLVSDAKKQIEKMKKNAKLIIEQEERRAVQELEKEAVDLAVKMAEDKLKEQVTPHTDAVMIDRLSKALSAKAA